MTERELRALLAMAHAVMPAELGWLRDRIARALNAENRKEAK